MKLSIIYPVYSIKQDSLVKQAIKRYSRLQGIEHIIVSSSQNDKDEALFIETDSRAARMNYGASKAQGEWLLFHHPRSIISPSGIEKLMAFDGSWGAFTHAFDKKGTMYSFTSLYSNFIRGDLRGIFYLDHCLFVKKEVFELIGGFDEVDIFEDTLISKKLKKISRPHRFREKSVTSAIRFEKNGFMKQALLNFEMKVRFCFHGDLGRMNKDYENGLDLNSHYSKD